MRLAFALFFLLLLPLDSAFASELLGTVVELEGSATIARSGTPPVKLIADDPIYMNDKIETGPGSKLLVLLIDDTQFTLGENASLVVDQYFYNPDDNTSSKGRYNVLKGAFLYTSGLLGKTQSPDIEINTAYGTLGIRGTTVWGGMLDGSYGVLVQEGAVDFRSQGGVTKLFANQGTFINNRTGKFRNGWNDELKAKAVATISLKNPRLQERIASRKAANQARRQELMENLRARRQELRQQPQQQPQKPSYPAHRKKRQGGKSDILNR